MKRIILLCCVLLAACGQSKPAPVTKIAEPQREALAKAHNVASIVEQQAADQLNKIDAETK